MESTPPSDERLKRPGGRSADVTERVHRAVVELLVEGGTRACTFTNIAEKAGVERSTLYRRFPDRWATIVDALTARSEAVVPTLGNSFREDLSSVLTKLADTLATPLGSAVLAVAAELSSTNYPLEFFGRRLEQLGPMFRAAIERGELPHDVDRETLFASAAGPVWFRMFIISKPVDEAWIGGIVDGICRLYCTDRTTASGRIAFNGGKSP